MGQIVKFVELVHDCILSKQQRNEMSRRYCDAIWSDRAPPAVLWGAVLLFIPYLWISIIHLWISIIYLWISLIHFRISLNNYGYP